MTTAKQILRDIKIVKRALLPSNKPDIAITMWTVDRGDGTSGFCRRLMVYDLKEGHYVTKSVTPAEKPSAEAS